jgi:hypothetical protein
MRWSSFWRRSTTDDWQLLEFLCAAPLVETAQLALELATAGIPRRHVTAAAENAAGDGRQGNAELKQGLAVDLYGNFFFRYAAELDLVDTAGEEVSFDFPGYRHQFLDTAVA